MQSREIDRTLVHVLSCSGSVENFVSCADSKFGDLDINSGRSVIAVHKGREKISLDPNADSGKLMHTHLDIQIVWCCLSSQL